VFASTLLRSISIAPTPSFETRKRPPLKALALSSSNCTPHSETFWPTPSM
jgi:hypothetical protein